MTALEVTVRKVGGQFRTDTINGQQGVSSTSPARAAERLAEILFGAADLDTARRVGPRDPRRPGVSKWRITDLAARSASHG